MKKILFFVVLVSMMVLTTTIANANDIEETEGTLFYTKNLKKAYVLEHNIKNLKDDEYAFYHIDTAGMEEFYCKLKKDSKIIKKLQSYGIKEDMEVLSVIYIDFDELVDVKIIKKDSL